MFYKCPKGHTFGPVDSDWTGYCFDCKETYNTWTRVNGPAPPRDPLLVERQKTHGSFVDHARITQSLKSEMEIEKPAWDNLNDRHKESLHMIQHKIGRILAGNPNFRDHWRDISGYSLLAMEACDEDKTV